MREHDTVVVDDALLRGWALPMPSDGGDKEERGRLLVIGGSRQMPGAVILAADNPKLAEVPFSLQAEPVRSKAKQGGLF